MKKIILPLFFLCCMLFSCSTTTPQDYFGRAVLNCNLLYGFAGNGMQREMASPSEKLVDEKTLATAPMKRAEVLKDKLQAVESSFEKVKDLSVTEDTKEMLDASTALYEYVLPVYKNEYQELATLYDDGAAQDKIEAMEKSITEKYQAKFLELYNAVLTAGKAYAAKHGIQVQEVNPSPSNY